MNTASTFSRRKSSASSSLCVRTTVRMDGFRRRAFGRIYSFRDVVGLRTIAVLRNVHRVPLQELRRVGKWLQERHDAPWSSLRFALQGRKVLFIDPDAGVPVEPRGAGQEVLAISHLDGRAIGPGRPGPLFRRMYALYQDYKERVMRAPGRP